MKTLSVERYKLKLQAMSAGRQGCFYAILLHSICMLFAYALLLKIGAINDLPNNTNLLNWDAKWYDIIRSSGYYYVEGGLNPMAFFPLFSFVWFLSGLSPIGISILNYIIFSVGYYLLASHLDFDFKKSLLFISTPSLFFCFIPYSEALFFLGASILLIGLDKDKMQYIIIGLLIASLSRSVGMVFIGAIVFVYIIKIIKNRQLMGKYGRRVLLLCSITIGVSLLVFFIQYLFSGQWFVFFKVQSAWNRTLQVPTLPLTTLTDVKTLWLDGLALFVCILAFAVSLYKFINVLAHKATTLNPSVLFSMAYLAIMGIISTFYSGIWGDADGTSLMSINRFVFATAFFMCFVASSISNIPQKKQRFSILSVFGLMLFTWLLLGAYRSFPGQDYLATLIYFTNMSVFVFAYFFANRFKAIYICLYVINLFIQLFLFNHHINNFWVA